MESEYCANCGNVIRPSTSGYVHMDGYKACPVRPLRLEEIGAMLKWVALAAASVGCLWGFVALIHFFWNHS